MHPFGLTIRLFRLKKALLTYLQDSSNCLTIRCCSSATRRPSAICTKRAIASFAATKLASTKLKQVLFVKKNDQFSDYFPKRVFGSGRPQYAADCSRACHVTSCTYLSFQPFHASIKSLFTKTNETSNWLLKKTVVYNASQRFLSVSNQSYSITI